MAQNDLTNFFNLMFDKRQTFDIAEGILQDKRDLNGRVSFVGNPVSQPVQIMQGATVSVGNRCLCIRPKSSARWIVLGSFGTQQTGYLPQRRPEDGFEIYPPGGIEAQNVIPGTCTWSWYAPPEKPIVFEVQTNTVASETGAVTQIRTRGSYYIVGSAVNLFLRVRSIQSDYNHSAWSSWYECAPGTPGAGVGTVTSVSMTVPTGLSVSGSPVTSSGGFTVSWATQSANKVFAGPSSGSAATPTFRDLVINDLPQISSPSLLGRYSSGVGHFEQLSIGAGLYIAGNSLNASGGGGGSATGTGEFVVSSTKRSVRADIVLYDYTIPSNTPSHIIDLATNPYSSQCKDMKIYMQVRGTYISNFSYFFLRPNGDTNDDPMVVQRNYSRYTSIGGDRWGFLAESSSPGGTSGSDSYGNIEGVIQDFNGSKKKIMNLQLGVAYDTSVLNGGGSGISVTNSAVDFGITAPITSFELCTHQYDGSALSGSEISAGSRILITGTMDVEFVTDVYGQATGFVGSDVIYGASSFDNVRTLNFATGDFLITDLGSNELFIEVIGGGGGGTVNSVVAGSHISVNNADPTNPILSAVNLVDSVNSGTDIVVNNSDPDNPIINWSHDIATQKLMGRYSSGSGHWEELALGTGLYVAGSGLYASATGISDEYIQDLVAALLVAGTNINLNYNDAGNTLTVSVAGLAPTDISGLTEYVEDVMGGGFIVAGTNISATYNDSGNTLTIAFTGTLATTVLTGILQAAQFPALTGDITTSAGSLATTLATVNPNVGSFTFGNFTVDDKGRITAASSSSINSQKILGRYSPGSGTFEEISIGMGLYISGSGLYASASGVSPTQYWQASGSWLSPISLTDKLIVGAHTGDAAAVAQIDSTTAGFLMPRMTTAQRAAIASPPVGLQIFNTDTGQIEVYGSAPAVPTLSDLAVISTNKLIGRATAGSGYMEQITLGTGLSYSGTTLNAKTSSSDDVLYEMLWIGGF